MKKNTTVRIVLTLALAVVLGTLLAACGGGAAEEAVEATQQNNLGELNIAVSGGGGTSGQAVDSGTANDPKCEVASPWNAISKLSDLDLAGCSLDKGFLSNSNWSNSDLSGATFRGALLVNANFTGANLTNVDFTDANMSGVVLDGADLTGATISADQLAAIASSEGAIGLP